MESVPLRDDPSKKFDIEWELAYPNFSFLYRETKDNKTAVFSGKLDYDCLFEKFGIKKGDNENNNANTLVNTIAKCFADNKVTIEPWQKKYHALEFKGEGQKTLFKVYLQN